MTSMETNNLPPDAPAAPPSSRRGKIWRAIREEWGGYDARRWRLNLVPRLLPLGAGGRLRAAVYRLLGLNVGCGTLVAGAITFGPGRARQVTIGRRCFLNSHVYLDPAASITLGDGVSVGHHVMIITSGHELGEADFRAGALLPKPVRVEDGVWIGAGATLLPGVTVGRGAVVAAGAVVTRDVPPNTLVGGVPARVIRALCRKESENP